MPRTDLHTELVGNVLHATLVPEGGASSFSLPLLEQLDAMCARAETDPGVRAVLVTGTGRTFSIGTDLDQIEQGLADFTQFRCYLDAFKATMDRLERLPVPTVAAVNGLTRAGGLELLLVCDLAVVADDAKVGDAHSPQFAIPAGGSTQRLPRRVGMPRAKDLIWSGRFLAADQAVEWGLCVKAVPPDQLLAEATALLATFTDKPAECLAGSKLLMLRSESLTIGAGCELEIHEFLQYVQNTPYVREAFEAFRAKQKS